MIFLQNINQTIKNMKKLNKLLNRIRFGLNSHLKKNITAVILLVIIFNSNANTVFESLDTFHNSNKNHESNILAFDQEKKEIKGVVYDELNQPMPGATVLVKGTTTGAVTDFDGKYSVLVPDGANFLIFSYAGYKSKEVVINSRTTIDVNLELDTNTLDEVVVVGYGSQRKISQELFQQLKRMS